MDFVNNADNAKSEPIHEQHYPRYSQGSTAVTISFYIFGISIFLNEKITYPPEFARRTRKINGTKGLTDPRKDCVCHRFCEIVEMIESPRVIGLSIMARRLFIEIIISMLPEAGYMTAN